MSWLPFFMLNLCKMCQVYAKALASNENVYYTNLGKKNNNIL